MIKIGSYSSYLHCVAEFEYYNLYDTILHVTHYKYITIIHIVYLSETLLLKISKNRIKQNNDTIET